MPITPDEQFDTERRSLLRSIAGVAAVTTAVGLGASSTASATQKKTGPYADPTNPVLEKGNMRLDPKRAALVVIDLQVNFMSPKDLAWPWVGESVTEHNVVQILHRLFMASKQAGMTVAISPHHYYPWDHDWKVQGPLELFQRKNGIFDRKGPIRSMVSNNPALIFCRTSRNTLTMARPSSVHRTSYMVPGSTISRSSCASNASTRSFLPGCWPTCVWSHTCESF